ncbi:hypothetical protein ACKWTF_005469 [Chironomus riparius]
MDTWIPYSSSIDRSSLVFVGTDYDGSPMYVGRAHHSGDLIPGKLLSSTHRCHVPYDGHEFSLEISEVLFNNNNNYAWVASSNGNIPPNAVPGGQTSNGETLYVGRATHNGLVTPGKIHLSHRCLYLPFGWKEHSYSNYEVLVRQSHKCVPPPIAVCPPIQSPFFPPKNPPCNCHNRPHHGNPLCHCRPS